MRRFFYNIVRASRSRGFGIQSPFAYHFVREVVRDSHFYKEYSSIPLSELSKERIRLSKFYLRLGIYLKTHENLESFLIIEGIHKTKEAYSKWKKIIKDDSVRVSFDLYDCGVLFFDEKMYKRNYKVMLK